MSTFLLFSFSALVGLCSKVTSKLCSNLVPQNSPARYALFLLINCLVGCLFFFSSGGGNVPVNLSTLLYAAGYALIVTGSILTGLIVLRYASISGVGILSGACSLLCTVLLGRLLFAEQIGARDWLRLCVMLIATAFVFMDARKAGKSTHTDAPKPRHALLPLALTIAAMTVIGCANTILLKYFVADSNVLGENSLFFYANAILCVGAAIVFLFTGLKNKADVRASLPLLHPKRILVVAGNTALSNVSSLLSVLLIARVDIAILSPVNTALGIIVGVVASLLFREKLGIHSYVAAAIACLSMFL